MMHRKTEADMSADKLIPMRLTLAVVLACCRADEARRRPARPMRQRDVDRWRARQRQHTYKPPAGARDAFKEQLARLRQQTLDAKHKQQPPPQAPHRPTPMPVNITCPATRRGCAADRAGGVGAGRWESATPRGGWMERWHWRLGTGKSIIGRATRSGPGAGARPARSP